MTAHSLPSDVLTAGPLASGIGSLPGTDVREAVRTVRDLLGDQLPYLPETPARGPGADMIGRAVGLLPGLHVDRQPAGWRFVDRPGKDASRTAALRRQDLDELAEAYDGWTGPLKVQVAGPWTLLGTVELTRGERAAADPGARRDVVASLAEGVAAHLAEVARLVPGARLVLQIDEPGLPAVLDGRLPTRSGYGRLRAVDRAEVRDGLREVLGGAGERETLVHCCAAEVPVRLLTEAGADGVALDTGLLAGPGWELVAEAVEAGHRVWAGMLPTDAAPEPRAAVSRLLASWDRVGLERARLRQVVATSGCGLAGLTPSAAVASLRAAVAAADELGGAVEG